MPESLLPRVAPLAESGLLVTFGDAIDAALSRRIAALTDTLLALGLPGVVDLVPSYTTLTVLLDPELADSEGIATTVREHWATSAGESDVPPARRVTIPVAYGGEHGPDVGDVAAHTGLSPEEIARRHSETTYFVAALGFAPGFAFLIGLPPVLTTPRRAEPRVRVPAGAVGIGGAQTGVYALPTPGGWNLIGRTPRRLFDPAAVDRGDDPFVLHAGDEVRFEPIDAARFEDLAADETAAPEENEEREQEPSLEVIEPGLLTTVQDLGRPGLGRFGVSPGGAADQGALLLGNQLVGNDGGVAALEITLLGPRLRFAGLDAPRRAALTGADLGAQLNGMPLASGRSFSVGDGDELSFDPAAAGRAGVRAYLCLAGGLDVPLVFASRATDLTAGFGGWHGRALRAGDRVPLGRKALTPQLPTPSRPPPTRGRSIPTEGEGEFFPSPPQGRGVARSAGVRALPIHFVRGPQADRFNGAAFAAFAGGVYTVTSRSDRVGVRLSGPAVRPEGGADVISEGVTTGAIQVSGDGQPIVMLPARATIGGYARIGTVIGADHDCLAQLPPGATVRFVEVSVAEARERTVAVRRMLRQDGQDDDDRAAGVVDRVDSERSEGGSVAETERIDGEGVMASDAAIAARLAELTPGAPGAWDPDGVRRIIEAVAETGLTDFELHVESAGLHLRIGRGGEASGPPAEAVQGRLPGEAESGMGGAEPVGIDDLGVDPSLATGDEATTVTAPMLGVFYRRPSPNDPLFAQPGETIAEGQTIGLIEVMKSFHEVPAPHEGTFDAYLADDGQSVEFGARLARLYRPDAPQRD